MAEIKPGYTRVTEIIGRYKDFSHIDPAVLQNKANIGTNVHEMIRKFYEGFFVPSNDWFGKREDGYFKSFLRWHEHSAPKVEQNSKRYYNDKHMLTGEVDAIMRFPNKSTDVLVDFKTSAANDDAFWPIQGAFYCMLAGLPIEETQMRFIRLFDDGGFPITHVYHYEYEYKETCDAMLLVHKYTSRVDKK